MSSLDNQYVRMMRGLNLRAYRQFTPARATAAKETPKVNGIKLNSNGTVTVHGTTYTRDEFRGALELNMREMRADPKSAYNDRRHPDHEQAVSEMQLGYKFLGGELTEADEREIVTEWHDATQESNEVATAQPYQQIAEMWKDPAVRAAKQRRDAGAHLDDREKEIMREYDRLENANNVIAYKERAVKSGTKGPRPYIPSDAMAWITNPQKEQRRQLAAEWKAKTLADPEHAYWHSDRGAQHKSAMLAMKAAYEMAETGECTSVQINPADGSVSSEE
jgi:hypothetical protein